jgi:hypothetical protein
LARTAGRDAHKNLESQRRIEIDSKNTTGPAERLALFRCRGGWGTACNRANSRLEDLTPATPRGRITCHTLYTHTDYSPRSPFGAQTGATAGLTGFLVVFAPSHLLFDSAAFDQLAKAADSFLN